MIVSVVPNAYQTTLIFPTGLRNGVVAKNRLSLPDALDGLGKTDIGGLELVKGKANEDGGGVEAPGEELAGGGNALLGDVVDNDVAEAGVGVNKDGGGEDGVHGRVERAGGEGSDGQGDKAGGDDTVEGPVVGAMRRRGGGNLDGVVDYRYSVRLLLCACMGCIDMLWMMRFSQADMGFVEFMTGKEQAWLLGYCSYLCPQCALSPSKC